MTASSPVLLSQELMLLVARFQDGLHQDMLAFIPFRQHQDRWYNRFWETTLPHGAYIPTYYVDRCRRGRPVVPTTDSTIRNLNQVGAALEPWFEKYGISRLGRLFQVMPFMMDVVPSFAVFFGSIDVVSALALNFPALLFQSQLLDIAALGGSEAMVDFLLVRGYTHGSTDESAIDWAKEGGADIAVMARLQSLMPQSLSSRDDDVIKAALAGDVDLVWHLFPRINLRNIRGVLWAMVKRGHLDLVQRIFEQVHPDNAAEMRSMCVVQAVRSGRAVILSWLLDVGPMRIDPLDARIAAYNGHFDLLVCVYEKYLARYYYASIFTYPPVANLYKWARVYSEAIDRAAQMGWLPMVQWVISISQHKQYTFLYKALLQASRHGQVNVVAWILPMWPSIEWRDLKSVLHAAGTNVDMLRLVAAHHPEACCIDPTLLDYVTKSSLDAIDYLWDVSWPRATNAMTKARLAHIVLLVVVSRGLFGWTQRVVQDAGYECISNQVLEAAVASGHLDVVQWLVETVAGHDDHARIASEALLLHASSPNMLQYLIEMAWSWQPLVAKRWLLRVAAKYGFLDLVQQLFQKAKGDEAELGDADMCETVVEAAAHGHMDVVVYLHAHCVYHQMSIDRMMEEALENATIWGQRQVAAWIKAQDGRRSV
ncbi:Aste57867_2431 [Aphanomyces stellatus]|uniref:Aste57867_2431 protein n=1 Tax=Aphanomyces stellatus TaxID=120398 RepID=A0A485KBA1_9STRA|nr:hypothetical protein As57867_002425 [Aphanomyces stellatus]VFT79632.1 Aste57867_2431 [Aphanomyces stellatus]